MSIFDIYKQLFKILEKMYFKDTNRYDMLGIILGEMSPELFTNSYSADTAFFEDFEKRMINIFGNLSGTGYKLSEGIQVLKSILQDYNEKYGYNLINVMADFDIFFGGLTRNM